MSVTFDGPNGLVILDAVSVQYTAQQLYSEWKRWVMLSDNAKYYPAFRTTAGDVVNGFKTPHFYFLQNDWWRLQKPEANISPRINGNFLFEYPNETRYREPDGDFTPTVEIYLDNISTLDLSGMLTAIAAAGLTEAEREKLHRVYVSHFHYRTIDDDEITLYASDNKTPLYKFKTINNQIIAPEFNPDL